MAKTYTCRDVGADCDWRTTAESEEEVLTNIGTHAAEIHPDIELTPELMASVRGVIKDA